MSEQSASDSQGISRRAMLKRGAVAGAAVAWTVPVISAISMTPAHAESPSAPASTSGSSTGQINSSNSQLASGSAGGGLASTGSDVSLTAAAGVAAAVLGAGAIAASKYRGSRTADDTAGE